MKNLFLLLLLCLNLLAASDSWQNTLIMDEGRLKPVDTYARHTLLRLSGKTQIKVGENKLPAWEWLATVVFTPAKAEPWLVFQIDDPQIADAYGIKRSNSRHYSFKELHEVRFRVQSFAEKADKKDKKERLTIENEFIRVYNNLKYYELLQNSFLFLRDHSAFTLGHDSLEQAWGLESSKNEFSYWEIFSVSQELGAAVEHAATLPKDKWSKVDSISYDISRKLFDWSSYYQNTLTVFLPLEFKEKKHWLAPWDILTNGLMGIDYLNREMHHLKHMGEFFSQGDLEKFEEASALLNKSILERTPWIRHRAVQTEALYNKMDGLYRSQILYGIALLLILLSSIFWKKWMARLSLLSLTIAIIYHLAAIGMRMYISERPPVTNLYETFVFVGLVCALFGLFIEIRKRDGLGLRLASFSGLALGLLANKNAPSGDTMGVLVAVLDSNFWLATHVIAITLGYAGVVAAGVLGHIYIFQAIFKRPVAVKTNTHQSMMAVLGFGLTLSFVGTILGGIWADQSWGRFWGWDPKENGALLIVLWVAILYHARLAGWLKRLGMAAGTCFGIVVVMLAWFGINLLGVGLHSYGFTDGAASALFGYVALQIIFLCIAVPVAIKRGNEKF